jgi:hypothetical protein
MLVADRSVESRFFNVPILSELPSVWMMTQTMSKESKSTPKERAQLKVP